MALQKLARLMEIWELSAQIVSERIVLPKKEKLFVMMKMGMEFMKHAMLKEMGKHV